MSEELSVDFVCQIETKLNLFFTTGSFKVPLLPVMAELTTTLAGRIRYRLRISPF
ncbi:hypothetical protein MJ585_24425 [Klebsiella pneumoniae]|nr:hypothetical protein MJ585_24425 [Klebsiella pneumoniae]